METKEYVIETHGLAKVYKGVQALQPPDLKVRQNSIFGFVVPNGVGKTRHYLASTLQGVVQ